MSQKSSSALNEILAVWIVCLVLGALAFGGKAWLGYMPMGQALWIWGCMAAASTLAMGGLCLAVWLCPSVMMKDVS